MATRTFHSGRRPTCNCAPEWPGLVLEGLVGGAVATPPVARSANTGPGQALFLHQIRAHAPNSRKFSGSPYITLGVGKLKFANGTLQRAYPIGRSHWAVHPTDAEVRIGFQQGLDIGISYFDDSQHALAFRKF